MYQILVLVTCVCGFLNFAEGTVVRGPLLDKNVTESVDYGADTILEVVDDVFITEGATLSIGAGSVVHFQPNANLIVTPGARIKVVGTLAKPIIFRQSEFDGNDKPGLEEIANGEADINQLNLERNWGALILCGSAPIAEVDHAVPSDRGGNRKITLEDLSLEVFCGGNNPDDYSGEIKYTRFERSKGGLILAGVGSRTLISHFETSFGSGNGLEIIGGDARANHVSLVYNSAACIEMSRGYRGMLQFVYCVTRHDVTDSRAFILHHGGTVPLLYGATVVGGGSNSDLVHITKGAGGEFGNLVFIRYGSTTNLIFHHCNEDQEVTQGDTLPRDTSLAQERDFLYFSGNIAIWDPSGTESDANILAGSCGQLQTYLFTRRGTRYNPNLVSIPAALPDWAQIGSMRVFDPRPVPRRNSYQVWDNARDREGARYGPSTSGHFFGTARFMGAFSQDLWLVKLSALDAYFHKLPRNEPFDNVICGPVKNTLVLSDRVYLMTCSVTVGGGGAIVVSAGTQVLVYPDDNQAEARTPFLLVKPGGTLHLNGIQQAPITFSSAMQERYIRTVKPSGLWGGIVVLGIAPVSEGIRDLNAELEPGYFGKDLDNAVIKTEYGLGVERSSTSGTIKYVRVWHAGAVKGTGGLVMGGVGSGTEVEHVEVALSAADGLQLRGGTVYIDSFSSVANQGTGVRILQGYQGNMQFVFALAHAAHGMLIGNEKEGDTTAPGSQFIRTRPLISHMTLAGVRVDTIESGTWSDPFKGVAGPSLTDAPVSLLKFSDSKVGADIRNSIVFDLNSEFSGIEMTSAEYCGEDASNYQVPPQDVNVTSYPSDRLYISPISTLVGIHQLPTRTTPTQEIVLMQPANQCPSFSVKDTEIPRDVVGCPQLKLQLTTEDSQQPRLQRQPSAFDPRLAMEYASVGGVQVESVIEEDPAVGFFRLDEKEVGAFPSVLWLQGLSILEDLGLLNQDVNLDSNLQQCQGVPTAAPTHRPTFRPTLDPTIQIAPTTDDGGDVDGNGDDRNGSGQQQVQVVETCGIFCVIGIVATIAAICVLLFVAYRVSRKMDLEDGRYRGDSYGDGLGGDTAPLPTGRHKEIQMTPRSALRENGSESAFAFGDAGEDSRAAVIV